MGLKSHDPCFYVFLMEVEVMIFVARCTYTTVTVKTINDNKYDMERGVFWIASDTVNVIDC